MLCYLRTYLYASYTNRSLIQYQWIKLKLNDLIQKTILTAKTFMALFYIYTYNRNIQNYDNNIYSSVPQWPLN